MLKKTLDNCHGFFVWFKAAIATIMTMVGIIMENVMKKAEIETKSTILLLDDDSVMLQRGREILKNAGYHVISVCDGIQGMDVIKKIDNVNLVVTDNEMTGLSGLELAEILHSEKPSLPIILVTSNLSEEVVARGQKAGIRGFLEKPYLESHMLGLVNNTIKH